MKHSLSSEYWIKRAARKLSFLQTEYGFDPPLSVPNREFEEAGAIWWRLKKKLTLTVFVEPRESDLRLEVTPYQPRAGPASGAPVVSYSIKEVAERLDTKNDAEFAKRMRFVRGPITARSLEVQLDRWAALLRIDCESMLRGNMPDWDAFRHR